MTPRCLASGAPLLVRAALVLGVLFAVEAAVACPVCFSPANEENRTAFMLMTGFLTVLPLVLIGFAVRWYLRRVKAFEKQNRAQRRSARHPHPRRRRERGRVVNAPEGYFERGYAGTPRGR